MNLDLGAIFLFQLLDLADDIAIDRDGRFPIMVNRPMCDNVFPRAIDHARSRVVIAPPGPVAGEDVVCRPAEQQIERVSHLLTHDISQDIVEIRDCPSAIFEAAAIVFPWSARPLHDAVERDERQNDELPHVCNLLAGSDGRMLLLRWNTFSGSYLSLSAVSRASLSGGYARRTPSAPSSLSVLTYWPRANGSRAAAVRRASAILLSSSAGSVHRLAATYSNAVSRKANAVSCSGTSAIAPPYACRPMLGRPPPGGSRRLCHSASIASSESS